MALHIEDNGLQSHPYTHSPVGTLSGRDLNSEIKILCIVR